MTRFSSDSMGICLNNLEQEAIVCLELPNFKNHNVFKSTGSTKMILQLWTRYNVKLKFLPNILNYSPHSFPVLLNSGQYSYNLTCPHSQHPSIMLSFNRG